MTKAFYYLALMRPANIVTAVSDILAGVAIVGMLSFSNFQNEVGLNILLLVCSTIGLYGGGVVFNDVFDYELDKIERPERPIPQGIIGLTQATIFGICLLVLGIFCASLVSTFAGILAASIAFCALFYDKVAKHGQLSGPLIMGCCRGLNLLLGMSIAFQGSLPQYWQISFIPILFIAAITLTSQGEVHGDNKKSVSLALALDVLIAVILLIISIEGVMNLWAVLPFIALWFGMNLFAKIRAITKNEAQNIMKAVKMGVLSLIPLDALYVAGFSGYFFGFLVLLLLPVSLLLAKKFAVT